MACGKDWDYFADSRRSQNRVHDSAASALYELGVAKGTGMGYFSPASTVSRGAMAAFITRALAHTTARPEGVTIQSATAGEAIVSVRDANFHPVANAPLDIFSARADRVGEAFNEDGSCNTPRLTREDGDAMGVCAIDALDPISNLSGDHTVSIDVNVKAGGTTVWAWTGESGDKVEDGGEGLASINLTDPGTVDADRAKVTNDQGVGVTRAHFGSTVTVTIQLVGDAASRRANAVPETDEDSYTVTLHRAIDRNIRADDHTAAGTTVDDTTTPDSKETLELEVDASGKVTFEITASDPDPTDRNNPTGADASGDDPAVPDRIDRVRVSYVVAPATANAGPAVATDAEVTGSSSSGTITFSDKRAVPVGATVMPTADFLTRPRTGSASNVVTVTVVDQYGGPVRGHLVRLNSTHVPATPTGSTVANESTFPVARRTDSSGSVRIGYSYKGAGSVETIQANTVTDPDATFDATATGDDIGDTKDFYWAAPAAGPDVAEGVVLAVDLDRNTIVVANSDGPQLVLYDDNDQYAVGPDTEEALTSMAAFEEALAADGAGGTARNDAVLVSSYDGTDSSDVARFVLTVN